MKAMVIGKGGREHAIVRGLKLSPSVIEVHAVPGSAGMAKDAICHDLDISKTDELIEFAERKDISLVVIGPEDPLADGLADALRAAGIATFGPNAKGAQLEASKVFSKQFMVDAGVPTAASFTVTSVAETLEAAEKFSPPYVLKANGLAAGKGVTISEDKEQLQKNAQALFEDKCFGEAGASALLEEFLEGWELSFLVLTNGKDFATLPLAQDHKRLQDGDRGLNTGGMGVVGPLDLPQGLEQQIVSEVVEPSLKQLQSNSEIDYRGVLYIGLMITESGPKVIEYNVRFGDPEAQIIFPLLDGDWGQVLLAIANGEVPSMSWKNLKAACIVMAAEGYPVSPKKGVNITGDVFAETSSSYFLHAGTGHDSQTGWVTSGGRVLNSIAIGSTLEEALKNSYSQAEQVTWAGLQMRSDIGKKVLAAEKSK